MKRMIKDYFSFSKKERTAVIILLLLAGVFMVLPYFFSVKEEMPVVDPSLALFIEKNKAGATAGKAPGKENVAAGNEALPSPVLFRFDPNTLTEEGWIRLGVTEKTAATILKYRNKGGKFRVPQDLRRIWGLPKTVADKLILYVTIASTGYPVRGQKETHEQVMPAYHGKKDPSFIDINEAATDEWKSLPGIGDVLAQRIVNYRERIGGFSSITQVKKVYGISDSVFAVLVPFLKADPSKFPKVDLNTVNPYSLAERTGIPVDVAKAITVYRQQYGAFKTVDDLKNIVFINDSTYRRIREHVIVK